MLILGLTGGIATGKSTVSALLSKDHGIPIIDADLIARSVVLPSTPAYAQIVATFESSTPDLLLPDGHLNRPALGRRIFNDDEARGKLNGITHPAVQKAMLIQSARHWLAGHALIVLDVPLLFEGGMDLICASTVVVSCGDEIQMTRLMKRDAHLTRADAQSRVNSQMSMTKKMRLADIVIENDGSLEDLKRKVDDMVSRVRPNRAWSLLEWICPPFGLSMGFWTVLVKYLRKRRQMSGDDKSIKAKL